MYWMTGTIDAAGEFGGPMTSNKTIPGGYRWMTYAERLEKAGVSWRVYQQKDNYGCNMLAYSSTFMNAPADSQLRSRAMTYGPKGNFEQDAIHDRLPTVSWIIPSGFQSEHP